ncbi:hypothetical protein TOL_1958 [Thalassolituus oleivorans MIL-1]|uniref:Uncharacterized protein n=1 Tax=Thalassolituus oleivorans MIL-1 TaxID=1298593 RepID=M5DT23_9GAMM|nr:hypothetical protein TOL_1958 [Thalassolituus oleivorans MIL-1]
MMGWSELRRLFKAGTNLPAYQLSTVSYYDRPCNSAVYLDTKNVLMVMVLYK